VSGYCVQRQRLDHLYGQSVYDQLHGEVDKELEEEQLENCQQTAGQEYRGS